MFDNIDGQTKLLAGLVVAAGLKLGVLSWMRERRKRRFERVGTVTKLIVYPVKSLPGVNVQEAKCTTCGLQTMSGIYDRHWMVTKPNGRFVSLRLYPKMALVGVKVIDNSLELSAPGKSPVTVCLPDESKEAKQTCSVWGSQMEGLDCGDEVGDWISSFLGVEGHRMLYYSMGMEKRFLNNEPKEWFNRTADCDWTSYADWAPYLLIPQPSISALNKELSRDIDERSFRPNIVIDGCAPFDEDNWEEIKFGDKIQMRCLDACTRCVLTTVDPDTGKKQDDGEPLKTLKRIRSIPPYDAYNEACFGINLAPDVLGTVKVGDPVYAIRNN